MRPVWHQTPGSQCCSWSAGAYASAVSTGASAWRGAYTGGASLGYVGGGGYDGEVLYVEGSVADDDDDGYDGGGYTGAKYDGG